MFQTVDTDFSPGDFRREEPVYEQPPPRFQTVDTDFSPGDIQTVALTTLIMMVSDR